MSCFGDQLLVILEHSGAKRDGNLSSLEQKTLQKLLHAEKQVKILEDILYETFILASESF